MSFWPFVRSPFTDLTANLVNHQSYGKCAAMEMKVMDCLEAYGMDRGTQKCEPLIRDFQECVGMEKQLKRFYVMTSCSYEIFLSLPFNIFAGNANGKTASVLGWRTKKGRTICRIPETRQLLTQL